MKKHTTKKKAVEMPVEETKPKVQATPKKRRPHIEVYLGDDMRYRCRLRAANGQLMLNNDPYDSLENANRAAESFAEQLEVEIKPYDPGEEMTKMQGDA